MWLEGSSKNPSTGCPIVLKPVKGELRRQGLTQVRAIAEKEIGADSDCLLAREYEYTRPLTQSSTCPVQNKLDSLVLTKFAPEPFLKDKLSKRQDGSVWSRSDYGLTPYWAERIKRQFNMRPNVDGFNRVPAMAQAAMHVTRKEDFFCVTTNRDTLYWSCPPYHLFDDLVSKIKKKRMRALVIALHWEHRSWWKPLMQMTLEAYQLPSPATGALLYHDENLTPHPQRSWSTVAAYVDGMSAPDDLTEEEQGMSSGEESDEDAPVLAQGVW